MSVRVTAREPVAAGDGSHRSRLLEGLAESIREKGLAATQVADIVRHARASRRTFYNEFPDKDSCLLALAQDRTDWAFEQVVASVDPALDWRTQIERSVDAYLRTLVQDRAMTITFAVELATLGKAGEAIRRAALERYAQFVIALAGSESLRRAGVRSVDRYTAIALVGGINELVGWAVAHSEPLEALAPSVKAILLAVLAPDPAGAQGPAPAPEPTSAPD